jgi:hypothetical protein
VTVGADAIDVGDAGDRRQKRRRPHQARPHSSAQNSHHPYGTQTEPFRQAGSCHPAPERIPCLRPH